MQLLTIGLVQLNPDGTRVLVDGNFVDTFTAADVSNLAHVFTGYDPDQSQNVTTPVPQTDGNISNVSNTAFTRLPLIQVGNNHSTVEPTFLGITVPTDAANGLREALDHLLNHSNTAPFIYKQLFQRLVTSNPSPAYIQRVGGGVRQQRSGCAR